MCVRKFRGDILWPEEPIEGLLFGGRAICWLKSGNLYVEDERKADGIGLPVVIGDKSIK